MPTGFAITPAKSFKVASPLTAIDGRRGVDNVAYVIDDQTGKNILDPRGHESTITQLQINSSNRWLAASVSHFNFDSGRSTRESGKPNSISFHVPRVMSLK
jgi:hypothetical protein